MRRIVITASLLCVVFTLITLPWMLVQAQQPEVFAEALGTANLRAGPGQEYDVVGEISVGTEYRVVLQHALVPWVLLEVPDITSKGGWVFKDLILFKRGDLNSVPFTESFDEIPATGLSLSTSVSAAPSVSPDQPTAETVSVATNPPPPLPQDIVTARLQGRSNIRYAPGTEYPPIAMFDEGTVFTVLARHSSLPWYKVAVEGAPTGAGWVFQDVIEITGDIYTLPVIDSITFDFPTPTSTPNTVLVANAPSGVVANADNTLANTLGLEIDNYLLSQGIAPRTDHEGSVFVLDLVTGQHFTLNGGVAYSGMSINKIPVLVSYFIQRDRPLEVSDAELVASVMICSENTSTNRMMTEVGAGDILLGGQRVTQNMQKMGLGSTFVVAPFFTGNPDATPAPVSSVQTSVDQQRTQPDLFNQLTVEDLGWLLGSVYQCAANYEGLLPETFPNQITQTECRQMLRVMSANRIGRLIEAGVPSGTFVAHKHGWVENTHGDAGIVIGPEGAYVLAMVNHQRGDWLLETDSFPALEEISRIAWNHFNPNYPQATVSSQVVPETCNIYGEPVVADLVGSNIAIPALPTSTSRVPAVTPTATPTTASFAPQTTEEVSN